MTTIWCMVPEIWSMTERSFHCFGLFFALSLTTQKTKFLKWTQRRYHFTYVSHKWQSYDVWFLKYGARRKLLSFWALLCPFTPPTIWKKNKILKNGKNTWIYHHCTLVYHKWRSYDAWFLKHGAWQTHFFVILDHFFPFNPTDDHKNQNFEKMIATSGDIIILHMCTINDNHMTDV